jgi:hypothetical protein
LRWNWTNAITTIFLAPKAGDTGSGCQTQIKGEEMTEITIGRTVLYTLTPSDAEQINRRRTTGTAIAERIKNNSVPLQAMPLDNPIKTWPLGAQAHIGNSAYAEESYPMVVVRVWPDKFGPGIPGVTGQVLLDGNDTFWVTSAKEGMEPGTWHWPVRT